MSQPQSIDETNFVGQELASQSLHTPQNQTQPLPAVDGSEASSRREDQDHGRVASERDEAQGPSRTLGTMSHSSPVWPAGPPLSRSGSRRYAHLPTPQSPAHTSYIAGVPHTPESPMTHGSSHATASLTQRLPRRQPDSASFASSSIMTPESSPLASRSSPTPHYASGSRSQLGARPNTTFRPIVVPESQINGPPVLMLAPAHQISPPLSAASPEARPQSRLSSPFMARVSLPEGTHVPPHPSSSTGQAMLVDEGFSTQPAASISTPPMSPTVPIPDASSNQEMQRISKEILERERAYVEEMERRRPEYLKRSKRSLDEADPSARDVAQEERDMGLPGVGITVSPHKGRRLKLFQETSFQETSEESFEESLMAGGYGRYRTTDWLEPAPPSTPGPSNHAPSPEVEAKPTEKEVKKRKRLAAFRESALSAPPSSAKLHPVDLEGKGRVLVDTTIDEQILPPELSTPKKRLNKRRRKDSQPGSIQKSGAEGHLPADTEGPNWPDGEFPWAVRLEEQAELAKAEELERLKWIEKFLDRDSDEEEEEDTDDVLPSFSTGPAHTEPTPPPRRGRGKMVPLRVDSLPSPISNALLRRRSAFFPSDPADARAALLSKKSVRALSFRNSQRRIRRDDYDGDSDEEVLCVCHGRDDGRELVQCDGCKTWYHLQCIGIKTIADLGKEEDPWFCDACESRAMSPSSTPELAPSSEPTFVPTYEDPSGSAARRHDPLFYQGTYQDSPMPSWSASREPPKTPTRTGGERAHFSSGSSMNAGPSTPQNSAQSVRVYTTPSQFDAYGSDDFPYDPTSTPSRGIKFAPPFATPKNNAWSARASGLFHTPLPGERGSTSTVRTDSSFPASDEHHYPSAYRTPHGYDDSPIRRMKPDDKAKPLTASRRLLESPLTARLTAPPYAPLEGSPVMRSRASRTREEPRAQLEMDASSD
ncbi:hypothetical protein PLICRDRAFT_93934 [Plicaturopsis crispa FD-325 SS-3]|nr:hypothetical protein PLICRDRAFT_93934 [Plicaturopsis crispa FD-325 SS-3]